MYQKDYLLFMIEQFGRILQRIVAKIAGGEPDDASYEIEQIYRQYLGVNSGLIASFSYEGLMTLQGADPDHYHDRCLTLAQLLKLEGDIFAKHAAFVDARGRYLKSLAIYLRVLLDPARSERVKERDAELRESVRALEALFNTEHIRGELPEDIATMLARFADQS